MKITIRPDPDCIELIRAEFKNMIIDFFKSIGFPENEADNWESNHTIEINENLPPMVKIFEMWCYLPEVLFKKAEWIFKISKNNLVCLFIISDEIVCCKLLNTGGLSQLPESLLNLHCAYYRGKTFVDSFSKLKNLHALKSICFIKCESLMDISIIENLINLQSINLSGCKSLSNLNALSGLTQLQSLNLSYCESLSDVSPLSGLTKLHSLDLRKCESFTDIRPLSSLNQLRSLYLSRCNSLADISPLSSLKQLQSLDLSDCEALTDISPLSTLAQLRSLDLSWYKSLTNIKPLFGLAQLHSLKLIGCETLADISPLLGLIQLEFLDLSSCKSLTDISLLFSLTRLKSLSLRECTLLITTSISGLTQLQSLDLSWHVSLTDISSLSSLIHLQSLRILNSKSLTNIKPLFGLAQLLSLDLIGCTSLTDVKPLSGLTRLESLNLSSCTSLTDVKPLSGLTRLQSLNLRKCEYLTDINPLSNLPQLQSLNLSSCESLGDINGLSNLVNLQTLDLSDCKRIQNSTSLRKCLALKYLTESNMHPAESAELLCFLAVQRNDFLYISKKVSSWLKELKLGLGQKHSSTNDLACSLAQGIVLANLEEAGLSFHQTLLNNLNVGITPWKSWFSENLKAFGWDKIQKLAESNQSSELTFGAIGGISSCLPSLEGDPAQINWAKKWISEIHSLHNTNPSFLKPAAAEWCLALKRLGEDELLREWIEKFTDPSDPSALDPINKVFSVYALDLNDSESALEYALKINDPKFRDESILNLAKKFIKEGDTTKAGEFLFLLTQVESRTQLALSLAENSVYLKSDENAHRLLAACGDNPQSLASILDKIRVANSASEILKFMHEKLNAESGLNIPSSLILQESNIYTNTLLKIKDPSQLVRIRQAIESVMKSS